MEFDFIDHYNMVVGAAVAEESQQVQDGAIEDIGTVLSDMAEDA